MRGWESLPNISKTLYETTYFLPNETYEEWLYRITSPYENDQAHGTRIRSYIRSYWFHPSTPISSGRGLPISCYVSHIEDTRESIFSGYLEGMWLGAQGGGRGVYWSDVRPSGSPISGTNSTSSGVIPFLGPSDRLTYSISQAGTRRSTEAAYLRIDHPDILDFIDIRLETGDKNRRMPNLHHGVVITDAFMEAVESLSSWDLIDPTTRKVMDTVDAYELWMDILEIRKTEAGEPYLLFIDTVNNNKPEEYRQLNMDVCSSNICTEITLYTDLETTAVCCLGSMNLEYWNEIEPVLDQFVADTTDFLDNVLEQTLAQIDSYEPERKQAFQRVAKSIRESRDIGLGVMGFHSLLQKRSIPFESPMAKSLNESIFSSIRAASDEHQATLSYPCLLSQISTGNRRNIHTLAIAPTMSISNLCNLASSGIEPWAANSFIKKLPQGTFTIKNKFLNKYISDYATNNGLGQDWIALQWKSIDKHLGSVQQLEWMDNYYKDVFKTAFEIDQRAVISLAGDRQKYIDQAQSVNLFLPTEVDYEELYSVHMLAWREGLKSLYYLRSQPETNADTSSKDRKPITLEDDVCVYCT